MKEFKIEGEEFASLCHCPAPDGPLIIDVMMHNLTPAQARKLSLWLAEAAGYVVTYNRKRKKKPTPRSE